jgi:prepilin-type N-terminal cleavage/methylation domain-containing protein
MRSGFTLLEIMLVVALMVIALTLALPALEPMMDRTRLTAARDMVRGRWADMRAQAMADGRNYRFAVTENTGRFRIAPDDNIYWTGNAPSQEDEPPLILEGELPTGVRFATSDAAFADENAAPSPGEEWGVVLAIYQADGSARDDAEVWFGKAGSRPLGLRLRALTGAVTSVDASAMGVSP